LTGTGAHGAYHAGALRALQEAGVKIDILAGHGVGAGSAALAALDGSPRLWDASGIWRSKSGSPDSTAGAGRFARRGISASVLLATLLTPLAVLLAGLLVYLAGFVLEMLQIQAGCDDGLVVFGVAAVGVRRTQSCQRLFRARPRLRSSSWSRCSSIVRWLAGRAAGNRRARGGWWWRVLGAPLAAEPAHEWFATAIWDLIRGAAPLARPVGRHPRTALFGGTRGEPRTAGFPRAGARRLPISMPGATSSRRCSPNRIAVSSSRRE
jgi:hypothetical protein